MLCGRVRCPLSAYPIPGVRGGHVRSGASKSTPVGVHIWEAWQRLWSHILPALAERVCMKAGTWRCYDCVDRIWYKRLSPDTAGKRLTENFGGRHPGHGERCSGMNFPELWRLELEAWKNLVRSMIIAGKKVFCELVCVCLDVDLEASGYRAAFVMLYSHEAPCSIIECASDMLSNVKYKQHNLWE